VILRVSLAIGLLTTTLMSAPTKTAVSSRAPWIKKADWIVVAHRMIPFVVSSPCGYPSKWRFEVEETLFNSDRVKPLKKGLGIEVAEANYDMLEVQCKRRQRETGLPPLSLEAVG
jgi:hypothetical protein